MASRVEIRFVKRIKIQEGNKCWLWTGKPKGGNNNYGSFYIEGKAWLSHRASYHLFVGLIGDKHVLHKCDNPLCVRPSHLYLGSHSDNMRDMRNKHRWQPMRGSQHGMAKLTEYDVKRIKKLLSNGVSGVTIATQFSVSKHMISKIKTGKNWRHI